MTAKLALDLDVRETWCELPTKQNDARYLTLQLVLFPAYFEIIQFSQDPTNGKPQVRYDLSEETGWPHKFTFNFSGFFRRIFRFFRGSFWINLLKGPVCDANDQIITDIQGCPRSF